jgi:pimeloyl-ACP methyl ester carboxylesterase
MSRSRLLLFLLMLLPAATVRSEPAQTGFVEHSYRSPIDDTTQPFVVFVPRAYDPARRWPLIIFLHGSGEWQNAMRPTEVGLPVRRQMESFPFLVAYPLGRGSIGFGTIAEQDVLSVLAETRRAYAVDDDRIYLTGLSMGGMGTWSLGLAYPHLWAAIAPVCGRGDPRLCDNALHLPAWVFHGDADRSVPVQGAREMVGRLRELAYEVRYDEYPDVGHNSWDRAYDGTALFDWFLTHRRVERPDRVVFRTGTLRHAQAYWLTVLALQEYGKPGTVDAVFDRERGTLTVKSENVDALYVDRSLTPIERFRIIGEGPRFLLQGKGPAAKAHLPAALRRGLWKAPGLSGPVEDVFYDRILFVIGTRGDTTATEANEVAARRAANWGRTAHVSFHVVRDTEVTREEMRRSHLILFGGPATNRIAAELNVDQLPLRLTTDGAQLGARVVAAASPALLYIYPSPRRTRGTPPRYVVVCDAKDRRGMEALAARLSGGRLNLLRTDWLLLDAGDASAAPKLVAEGWFDGNWQMTPAAPEPAHVPGPPTRPRWPKPILAAR